MFRIRCSLATIALTLVVVGQDGHAQATDLYPKMAPLGEYLIANRNAEIEMARSAAPSALSISAKILVLGPKGYETAVEGNNGFVCLVVRSWVTSTDRADFWNPKIRGPVCLNAAAVKSVLPHIVKKTEWVLAGLTKQQIAAKLKVALRNGQLRAPLPLSFGYAMSRSAYIGDVWQHWHPHLMFFYPFTVAAAWGAELPGSPIIAQELPNEHLTICSVPVTRWSDGSLASAIER